MPRIAPRFAGSPPNLRLPLIWNSDLGIARNAAGVARISDGSTGYGELQVRAGASTSAVYASGVMSSNVGNVATSGTIEESLMSYVLPANALNADGRGLRITAWGSFAANGNTKVVLLMFGATDLQASIINGAYNGSNWRIEAMLWRTGAATQKHVTQVQVGSSLGSVAYGTPAETLSGAVTIDLRATTATQAGDVTARGLMVEILP